MSVTDEELRLEVIAASARLFLRAEEPSKALLASQAAIALADSIEPLSAFGRAAHLDSLVTYATEALNLAPTPETREAMLGTLDSVRDKCLRSGADLPGSGEIAGRAINNALIQRLKPLYTGVDFHSPETQVQAWIWVEQARSAIAEAGLPGADLQPVNRQAVDLARQLGAWERAWVSVTESLRVGYQRNERVTLLAKAARLAWERANLADAITFGQEARTASIAVGLPWVRLYAYQAGVIATAAGSGNIYAALTSYENCVDKRGHASRPDRAWETAQIALDAGADIDRLSDFLRKVSFHEHASRHRSAFASVILADHSDSTAPRQDWDGIEFALLSAPDRARFHLAAARAAIRNDRYSAAAIELRKGREYLRLWPGRIADSFTPLATRFLDAPPTTPAQQQVLDLLVEGLSNNAIAHQLKISPRTVAVHVQALLRNAGANSRTNLALSELRRRLTEESPQPFISWRS
ncbi:hypothetical protein GCM10027404_21780 [Arthrobacter tumbae]|uniref:helix-turn-helix transcriptional regulator n=1 Tax=Arthrobacter tumbae TaxID=163874 RepID=UPI0019585C98|nr:LuxR C-terminal-related transcriptional regulator [Arthrobacter tumbae]MBM7781863.1 DNA-binding NarL/FixJ family response regulator [Arthrobacter tumbae]